MRDNLTPKMHTVDDSFTDVTASLTFFQRTTTGTRSSASARSPSKRAAPGGWNFHVNDERLLLLLDTESATVSKRR